MSKKNISFIKERLKNSEEDNKDDISNTTKEVANKIVYIYDNLCTAINEQRCENLKLQLELTNLTKEKNSLRYDVDTLTESVRLLENVLGVNQDPIFEAQLSLINFRNVQPTSYSE